MRVKKFDIWLADLNPPSGTEAGKVRPVLVVQTDLLNKLHPSTLVCPLTTNIQPESLVLRVHIRSGSCGLHESSDVIVDQLRAIDNKRLVKKLGALSADLQVIVKENLKIILDLE